MVSRVPSLQKMLLDCFSSVSFYANRLTKLAMAAVMRDKAVSDSRSNIVELFLPPDFSQPEVASGVISGVVD